MFSLIYKTYLELIKIDKFEERFDYLNLFGVIGEATFGGHRILNQVLYQTEKWKSTRREVILRDNGCDLAHKEYQIYGAIYIHHINPITIDDILKERPCVFDLNNLVCTSFKSHNAIHYGSKISLPKTVTIRQENDTCLW